VTTPQLDRRRAQSAAAGAAAEKARLAVTELDNRLRTNTELGATVLDGSGYVAALATGPDFGCVNWEST